MQELGTTRLAKPARVAWYGTFSLVTSAVRRQKSLWTGHERFLGDQGKTITIALERFDKLTRIVLDATAMLCDTSGLIRQWSIHSSILSFELATLNGVFSTTRVDTVYCLDRPFGAWEKLPLPENSVALCDTAHLAANPACLSKINARSRLLEQELAICRAGADGSIGEGVPSQSASAAAASGFSQPGVSPECRQADRHVCWPEGIVVVVRHDICKA